MCGNEGEKVRGKGRECARRARVRGKKERKYARMRVRARRRKSEDNRKKMSDIESKRK